MAVTLKQRTEAAADTNEIVKLEVVGVKRWVPLGGDLYEAGVIYNFTRAQADRLLKVTVDGKPVFDFYRPERHKKMVVVGPQEVDMTVQDLSDLVPQSARRIDLGDESELAGIPGIGEDSGEGVRV